MTGSLVALIINENVLHRGRKTWHKAPDIRRRQLTPEELEDLRLRLRLTDAPDTTVEALGHSLKLEFWLSDFSGSGYRLHARTQMIHQQYAMALPVDDTTGGQTRPLLRGPGRCGRALSPDYHWIFLTIT